MRRRSEAKASLRAVGIAFHTCNMRLGGIDVGWLESLMKNLRKDDGEFSNGDSRLHSRNHSATMKRLFRNFGKVHLYIFLGFYVSFAALTFFVLNAGSESDRRENQIVAATVGTVSGPFAGAIARHLQSCCWRFSLAVFPYCALFLGASLLSQIVPLPFQRFERTVRLTMWCIGLLGWFGGALVSFAHALS